MKRSEVNLSGNSPTLLFVYANFHYKARKDEKAYYSLSLSSWLNVPHSVGTSVFFPPRRAALISYWKLLQSLSFDLLFSITVSHSYLFFFWIFGQEQNASLPHCNTAAFFSLVYTIAANAPLSYLQCWTHSDFHPRIGFRFYQAIHHPSSVLIWTIWLLWMIFLPYVRHSNILIDSNNNVHILTVIYILTQTEQH